MRFKFWDVLLQNRRREGWRPFKWLCLDQRGSYCSPQSLRNLLIKPDELHFSVCTRLNFKMTNELRHKRSFAEWRLRNLISKVLTLFHTSIFYISRRETKDGLPPVLPCMLCLPHWAFSLGSKIPLHAYFNFPDKRPSLFGSFLTSCEGFSYMRMFCKTTSLVPKCVDEGVVMVATFLVLNPWTQLIKIIISK